MTDRETDAGEAPAADSDAAGASDAEDVEDADDADDAETATAGDVTARYRETETERLVEFETDGRTAAIAQNRDGYAMLKVRPTADGDELERYYGFDVALDHAAELLGVPPGDLPVPDAAADMGM